MTDVSNDVREFASQQYKYGFSTDLDTDAVPKGLSEDVIRLISAKKHEPDWLLEWRLRAYRHWITLEEPHWQNVHYGPIDYQDIIYYAATKPKVQLASLDEVDPELRTMFDKLGISLAEQERLSGVAVDAIVDSVSVATTFKRKLADVGVIFCSFSEAVQTTRSWCVPISARWSPTGTTTLPPSIRPSSPTARSASSPKACTAPWSSPPTSASTPRTPASSNAPSSSQKRGRR